MSVWETDSAFRILPRQQWVCLPLFCWDTHSIPQLFSVCLRIPRLRKQLPSTHSAFGYFEHETTWEGSMKSIGVGWEYSRSPSRKPGPSQRFWKRTSTNTTKNLIWFWQEKRRKSVGRGKRKRKRRKLSPRVPRRAVLMTINKTIVTMQWYELSVISLSFKVPDKTEIKEYMCAETKSLYF